MKMRNLAAAGAFSLAVTAGAASAAETKFNASIWLPPAHPLTIYGYSDWLKKVEEKSGGALKPTLFTGSALLAPQDHLSGVRDGIAQVGWINGSYSPSDLPEDNVLFQMSFVYTDYFVSAFAATELNMTDPQLQKQWARNNIVYLSGYSTPPYRLICSSKIATLGEIAGKKLRSGGGALPDWAKSVGAIPVNVASSESYSGLEKGQLDCATNALDDLRSRSYWDVAKHVSMVELGSFWTMTGANQDFWRGLTDEQRKAFLDATAETMVDTGVGYLQDVERIVREAADKNVQFHEPEADLEATIKAHKAKTAEYAAEIGSQKLGVANAGELIDRLQVVARKWEKLLANVDYTDRAALLELLNREVYGKIDPATYGMR